MKWFLILILFLGFLAAGLAFRSFFLPKLRDEAARKDVSFFVERIKEYKEATGSLPEKLQDLPSWGKINNEKIYYIFNKSEIYYDIQGDFFRVYFYGSPLGPFEGYDSKSNERFWEE